MLFRQERMIFTQLGAHTCAHNVSCVTEYGTSDLDLQLHRASTYWATLYQLILMAVRNRK